MDPTAIINLIATIVTQAVTLGPTVIKGVEDAVPFAEAIYENLVDKQAITAADLDALDAQVQALVDQATQPLPPDA